MKVLLVVTGLVASCLLLVESAFLEGSIENESNIYTAQIRVLSATLAKECPQGVRKFKRQLSNTLSTHLEIQKTVYNNLLKELVECRHKNTLKSTSKRTPLITKETRPTTVKMTTSSATRIKTTTKTITPFTTRIATIVDMTTPTTKIPIKTTKKQTNPATIKLFTPTRKEQTKVTKKKLTTAMSTQQADRTTTNLRVPTPTNQINPTTKKLATAAITKKTQPVECQQAVNYTQSWRRDKKGSDIRPGGPYSHIRYACDHHPQSTQWFRFSGAAGTHMLDSCPKWKSCGTEYPFWTDERMPRAVGVEVTVKVYGVYRDNCRRYSEMLKVMRCSRKRPNDLIYKQTRNYRASVCSEAYCSMN